MAREKPISPLPPLALVRARRRRNGRGDDGLVRKMRGVGQLALASADPLRVAEFYESAFGFNRRAADETGVDLELAGFELSPRETDGRACAPSGWPIRRAGRWPSSTPTRTEARSAAEAEHSP
jgi:hypothetical protein